VSDECDLGRVSGMADALGDESWRSWTQEQASEAEAMLDQLLARVAELEADLLAVRARLALAERVIAVLRGRDAPSGEHSWREWHRMLVEWDGGET